MNPIFKKAERSQVFLKLAITGPTGSGKTYSALRLAVGLLAGTDKRVAFIDTENDSASLYSDRFDFDVVPIAPPFDASHFVSAINAAIEGGYGAVIIDSASHFWKGILSYKDKLDKRGGNQYTNWGEADKPYEQFMEAVLQSKIHLIFCMRSKMDYVLEDKGGKQTPRRVGLAPIFRDGSEFEFTTVFDVAEDHNAKSSKDRSGLFDGKIFQITEDTGKEIAAWLKTAKPKPPEPTDAEKLESERILRITGRKDAAEKERSSIYSAAEWFDSYALEVCTMMGVTEKSLDDMTVDELKFASKNHAAIIEILKGKTPA